MLIQQFYKATSQDNKNRSVSDTVWHTTSTGINGYSPALPIHCTTVLFIGSNDTAQNYNLSIYASAMEDGPYYNTGLFVPMTSLSPCYNICYGVFPYVKLQSPIDASLSLKYVVSTTSYCGMS